MNYNIRYCGLMNKTFDTVLRLMIESASGSDYLVTTTSHPLLSPYAVMTTDMLLIGSAKKDQLNIVVDFDDAYIGASYDTHLKPKEMNIDLTEDQRHHWGVIGALFKIIPDLSPAYITSYLIDKGMNAEMALFKQFSVTGQ